MIKPLIDPRTIDYISAPLRECLLIGFPLLLAQVGYVVVLLRRHSSARLRFQFSLAEGLTFFLLASLPVTYAAYVFRFDPGEPLSCWNADIVNVNFYSLRGFLLALSVTVSSVLVLGLLIGKLRHDQVVGVNGGAANSILMGGWISVLCYMAVFTSYAWLIR